jgi:hypothetical protein
MYTSTLAMEDEMLEIDGNVQEYFDDVKKYAEEIGLIDSLQEQLDYLDTYAEHGDRGKTRCRLFKDFAPHSFQVSMEIRNEAGEYKHWWSGGCIFHGPHDGHGSGSFPTLSVTLNPCHEWQIHT